MFSISRVLPLPLLNRWILSAHHVFKFSGLSPECRPLVNLQVAVVVRIIKSHQGGTIGAKRSNSGGDCHGSRPLNSNINRSRSCVLHVKSLQWKSWCLCRGGVSPERSVRGVCGERKNDETTKKGWVECQEAFERLTSGQMGSPETQGFKGAGEKVMQCKRNRPGGKKERREVRRDAWEPDRPIAVVRLGTQA